MSSTVSKTGINIGGSSTSPVSFSTLRSTFIQSSSGSVSASGLLRDTSTSNTNPVVPDATENSNIVTSQSNWRVSHFQQSVKFYDIIQSGDEIHYIIHDQSWNNNLNKNVRKKMQLTGTCGATDPVTAAARFNSGAYNLTVEVTGSLYGYGGRGGGKSGAPAISGEGGWRALRITSNTGTVTVTVGSNAKLWGGGGGGEKGAQGARGSTGKCVDYSYYERRQCGSCPNCNGGDRRLHCYNRQGRCRRWYQYRDIRCRRSDVTSGLAGGAGGAGGNGGNGRGWNNFSGSTSGVAGLAGAAGGCSGYDANGDPRPRRGKTGETGGNGGDWGQAGGNTKESGSGGVAGPAIWGQNFSVSGSVNSSTLKGSYSPS